MPIVAVSAHKTIDHRAKAFAVGFDDYITEPLNFAQLLDLVQRFLQPA